MYLPMWLIFIVILAVLAYAHEAKKNRPIQVPGYNPFPSDRKLVPTELTGYSRPLVSALVTLGATTFGLSVLSLLSTLIFGWLSILASVVCAVVGVAFFGVASLVYKVSPKEFYSVEREEARKAKNQVRKEQAQDAFLWFYGILFALVAVVGLVAVLFSK